MTSAETKVLEMETTVEDLQWDIEKLRKREQKLNKHLAEALEQVGLGCYITWSQGPGWVLRAQDSVFHTYLAFSLISTAELWLLCVWELLRLSGGPDHTQHAEGEQASFFPAPLIIFTLEIPHNVKDRYPIMMPFFVTCTAVCCVHPQVYSVSSS